MSFGTAAVEPDPFAHIVDEAPLTPHEAVVKTLDDAKRGWFPLRKSFVQRPKGSVAQANRPSPRASVLYDLVHGKHQRPLDLLLMLHAFQPVLDVSPLKLATWAHMLSARTPCTSAGVSRAVDTLENMDLVRRIGSGHAPELRLLREDGEHEPWFKAGSKSEQGPGYFVVPHAYWTSGLFEKLTMPGQAMLFITLAETQNPTTPSFKMAYERTKDWYGLSERTAERGFRELSTEGYLLTRVQKVPDRKHPVRRREDTWRALAAPFSSAARQQLQGVSAAAARATASATVATGGAP